MPSSHVQARKFIEIFDGIHTFREVEKRIAKQQTTKNVGDAFEIFVEGYLATQKIMQADKVWLVGQIPLEIRQKLNLPANTKGVDGVFRTLSGDLVPYQVKFRCSREPLTYTEVASFLGLTERAKDRVIFTNAMDVARDAKTRDAIRTVRAQDFNRLTREDFLVIERWLRHDRVEPSKRIPRPYQKEAIDRILNTFRTSDRAIAVMACGTGKTLVGLWVAEAIGARRVLVFVPSLALLSQTLKEWSRWTSWGTNYQYLCVCSDPTVSEGMDAIQLDQIDAPFPINTDPDQVRHFLHSNGKGIQVIFSTYQSAPVVMKGANGLYSFDLAILDEAHKTAGMQGTAFALPLSDDNISIKKRLFLTATPRHYDIRHRDREGDFRVISMDNRAVYGPVAYRLTFAEAAKKGIICNYKIIVSVVDGKEVNEFALAHGITLVDKTEIAVRWVAYQLALQKAIKKVRATRVITFHTTVQLAQRFASRGVEGITRYLKGFSVYHVNGEQSSAVREDLLDAFRLAQLGAITNARCLTEGIDVPAVDLIAFMNPRRSRIDIAQATGRAMRKAGPEKAFGYVVVPLFLNQRRGESLEQALERSDFDDVANVLNAMQEQDDDFVDIIRELREARGRLGRFNSHRLRDKIQVIGPRIPLNRLRSNIFVQVIDRLGLGWDEYYGKLVRFRELYGHCNVPSRWAQDRSLAGWVNVQRTHRARLSQTRIERLDALGFIWEVRDAKWEQMYKRLVAYKVQHGHCNVTRQDRNPSLASWVFAQRHLKDKLTAERKQQLEALGFEWDPSATYWEEMYKRLAAYKTQYADCNVPRGWEQDPTLARWVSKQRDRKEQALPERIQRLDALGFNWDPSTTYWEKMYSRLAAYKKQQGNCIVSRYGRDKILGTWVGTQRNNKAKLIPERVQKLNALGFEWDPFSTYWEKMYKQLVVYKKEHGHCNASKYGPEKSLGTWVYEQRKAKADDRMSLERTRRLDALGFAWDPRNVQWEEMYGRLTAYKKSHGHCNPSEVCKDRRLVNWVSTQRMSKDRLPVERKERLDALGFTWEPKDAYWEKMYDRLVNYKKQHRDCNVPTNWRQDRRLAVWVANQRHRTGQCLSSEKKQRLEALGFDWNPFNTNWEEMYERLLNYKKQYGDCNVPQKWQHDRSLGTWVNHQRNGKKQVQPERIDRLDAAGFIWDVRDALWEEMYKRLSAYKDKHGNCNVPRSWTHDQILARWVSKQRDRKAQLSSERIQRLEGLGFDWDPSTTHWEHMYKRLLAYNRQCGDCNVSRYGRDKELAHWVYGQRRLKEKDLLSPERERRLELLGFEWDPAAMHWKQLYERLVAYKDKNGNCNVPQKWRKDRSLATWVANQRQRKRKGQLSRQLIQLLNALRFEWEPTKTKQQIDEANNPLR